MELAERAVVRVFRGGSAVGMGFLVGEDLVLTCAHVAGDQVDFPLLGGASAVSEVFRSEDADVAVLRLAEVPAGARALRVVAHDELRGHRVRAFGVTAHRTNGVWSHGVVRGPIAGGRIHVEDDRSHGVPLSRGFSGGPLLDDSLGAVVGMVVEVEERADRRIGYALSGASLHRTWPDLAALAVPGSPFRGLEPFGPQDAEHFFGRADRARELRDQLDGTGALVVAGPSGCGKSSLVMAGLLPLLEGESVVVRPATASTPWAALSTAFEDEVTPDRVEDAVNRLLVHRDLRRLTIVVDQFDEALARHPDAPDFLHALLGLVRHRAPRVDLVVTTTTEPLLRLTTDPRFSALPDRTATVGTPDLREVVEGPLRPIGMPVLQEGLADALLADLAAESNPLPLLEFTLTLLWDRQDRGVLTHQAYRDLGGVAGAVSTYAERVWRRFDPAEIRHALTQLVSPLPGRGHVRRAVPVADLGEIAGELARTRLVTLGPSTVELAHHALVDHWQRLHDWVEASRDFRTWQDDLDRTAHRWTESPDRALLLRGKPLRTARATARGHRLTKTQRRFLAASAHARTRRTAVRGLAATLVALLAFALVTAIRTVGDERARFAVDAATRALLDRAAVSTTDSRIVTTLRAYRTADRVDTRTALRLLANQHRYTTVVVPGTATPNPSGTRLFDEDRDELWDLTADPPRRTPGPAQRWTWAGDDSLLGAPLDGIKRWDVVTGDVTTLTEDLADTVVSDGSGRWIAYARDDAGEVRVRAPDGRTSVVPLPARRGPRRSLVGVLPTGEVVVEDGTGVLAVSAAGVRDLGPGTFTDRPGQAEPTVTRCVDTGLVAVGASSGATVAEVVGGRCTSGVFSPDLRTSAATSDTGDETVLRLGPIGGERLVVVPDGSRVRNLAVEPSGHYRVVLSTSSRVAVLRVPPEDDLDRAVRRADSVQFAPDRAHVVLRTWDSGSEVWHLQRRARVGRAEHTSGTGGWAFSSAAPLAAIDDGGRVLLFAMPDLAPLGVLGGVEGTPRFQGVDRLLVQGSRQVYVVDVGSMRPLGPEFGLPEGRPDEQIIGAAAAGAREVAVVTDAGRVLRFDVGTGLVVPGSEFSVGFPPERLGTVVAADAAGDRIALQRFGAVEVWDLRRRERVAGVDLPLFTVAVDVRFRADPDQLELDLQVVVPAAAWGGAMAVHLWERDPTWALPALLGGDTERLTVLPGPAQAGYVAFVRRELEPGDPAVWAAVLCGVVARSGLDQDDVTLPAGAARGPVC
ncbi:S1 family peptidase [Saccharothrix variisporea]|uniref:Trypsin-like peptidase n=1 Tax=Saccharothrix variisporea TaxID=543527 RepID=A0A495XFD2_9PSEU|nr:serine protease [Saccharothrix variisporea]RKT72399.1 trypsin-like peptidase [Saccharothrix variisporea]